MPIATTCPNCKALFRLAETLAGKKVRCQKCRQVFVAPVPPASPPPVAPAPAAPTPPMALSLDDEPMPASVVQSSAAPKSEVVQAAVVEPPMEAEVIEATVAAPPGEPIIEAQLAVPPVEKTPRKSSNDGSSQKPRPRRAADLPKYSSVGAGFLAALAILLVCVGIIAFFGGIAFVMQRVNGP